MQHRKLLHLMVYRQFLVTVCVCSILSKRFSAIIKNVRLHIFQ